MFDTFVFRLHRLAENYPMLANMARTTMGKEWVSTDSEKPSKKQELRTWMHSYKDDVAIPLRYSDKRNIPSSNHDIPFTIDWTLDYLEANVSIPKMIFGTNVLELITPVGHKNYTVNATSPADHVDYCFDLLKQTVTRVLLEIAHGNYFELTWSDVEIVRLDVCVNQHFESKEECLRYLHHQKTIHKKHNRLEGASNSAEWKTSMTFKTARYYAKIYHKGTEFKQKQTPYIVAINEDRERAGKPRLTMAEIRNLPKVLAEDAALPGPRQYKNALEYTAAHLPHLQEYADRILRYELEFKKPYLSYIFNRKVSKQWSQSWQESVRLFDFFSRDENLKDDLFNYVVKYVDLDGNEHKKRPLTLVASVKLYHKRTEWTDDTQTATKQVLVPFTPKEVERLSKLTSMGINDAGRFKAWMKFMTKELNKSRKFMFALDADTVDSTRQVSKVGGKSVSMHPYDATPETVRFTKSMMYELLASFDEFFKNFQVLAKNPMHLFQDLLDEHDKIEKTRKKLGSSVAKPLTSAMRRKLLQFHRLHGKYTYKDLVPKEFSKPTYFRIKKLYESITKEKGHLAHEHFSNGIIRDLGRIYEPLYAHINFGFLSNYYNSLATTIAQVRMTA